MLADKGFQATLPAADLERAKQFYADKLGLTPEREDPTLGQVTYRCGQETRFSIYLSQGKSEGHFTQGGWLVDDIEREVAELKTQGVVFEEYNSPPLQTVNGVASVGPAKSAWFRDSEGNLLGLLQVG
jgi:catechol 2,3-dioxygenase-like lactoylglutathione lyase family enzyme